ncbi:hypothetical protein Hypma_016526 [Hypsizygus marmoreus]|uniref:Uncharacterized protein n=1 Tax=Hypsizygus marmoreus TaxID=39966 RepID=A0A369IYC5_HYPMA|nr:hypothetical protein Hypma_016526 [Hypsizygus marmoreus]
MIHDFALDDFLTLLANTPCLKYLDVRKILSSQTSTTSPVVLPSLHSLVFSAHGSGEFSNHLTLQSLVSHHPTPQKLASAPTSRRSIFVLDTEVDEVTDEGLFLSL